MLEFIPDFFTFNQFIPDGDCYLWHPGLLFLHIASSLAIALAYYSIPINLFYLVRKKQNLPFNWIFLLLGTFIVLGGSTHLAEVWTFWHPNYWFSGVLKAVTAGVSVYTSITVSSRFPQLLNLLSVRELEVANRQL